MKHSVCRLSIAIALIAGMSGHLGAQGPSRGEDANCDVQVVSSSNGYVSVDDYVQRMRCYGWTVQQSENLAGNITIELERDEEGPEEHGLFGIRWLNRVNWKFMYSPQGNDTLMIQSAEGERRHKAPLFGKWKTIERYGDDIPTDIFQRELRSDEPSIQGYLRHDSHG